MVLPVFQRCLRTQLAEVETTFDLVAIFFRACSVRTYHMDHSSSPTRMMFLHLFRSSLGLHVLLADSMLRN